MNKLKTPSYTGRQRRKRTRLSVRMGDIISKRLITIGGIGTIVAVSSVFLFLFGVVAPLFLPALVTNPAKLPAPWGNDEIVRFTIDEYQTMAWSLSSNGQLRIFRLDTGEDVDKLEIFSATEHQITSTSFSIGSNDFALGFSDGTVQLGKLEFIPSFLERSDVPPEIKDLPVGGIATFNKEVLQKTPQGQFRSQHISATIAEPLKVADSPIELITHLTSGEDEDAAISSNSESSFIFYAGAEKLQFCRVAETQIENDFTGEVEIETELISVDLPLPASRTSAPFRLLLSARGDNAFVAWQDGVMVRYNVRKRGTAILVEEINLLRSTDNATLTTCDFILNRETILCGDSTGQIRAWFRRRHGRKTDKDLFELVLGHEFSSSGQPVTAFGSSSHSRTVAVGYQNGDVRLFHITTDQELPFVLNSSDQNASANSDFGQWFGPRQRKLNIGQGEAIQRILLAPKDDGIVAATKTQLWRAEFDAAHPEATLSALFQPVWYEGYSKPENIWQSSYGSTGPEMKLGLGPLIFGTIKATFYTMLFGAPLALLAAIYTSEFLSNRMRSRIKPMIEMMASLPSVVLGFLAALVFAPVIETMVPTTLAAFVMLPLAYLLGSYLWQMIPKQLFQRLQRYRFSFLFLPLAVGFFAAVQAGPWAERLLFAGNIKAWMSGRVGSGSSAWLLLFLPICSVATVFLMVSVVNPFLRQHTDRLSRGWFAQLNTLKFIAGTVFAGLVAFGISWSLSSTGFDPRGSFVDKYEQKNVLVVGFVMGFAVIPIIYTIADDALSTVPNHLRSASLGCGATQWQTSINIVIPTAMSGLFSALMIGLGRAVGETMIVLMAGGNTPVTDWNIFNGFRTLSANIAVELPEAVKDSTHYRTLFLAALTLFVLTFLVNTIAEVVRLRFRRRAYQL